MGAAVGVVPVEGRGDLPLAELHGEPVFVHAVRALLRAGVPDVVVTTDQGRERPVRAALARTRPAVEVAGARTWWAGPGPRARLVLAGPLCPLVPADFVARLLAEAPADRAVAAYRPVTDTVKTVVDQRIAGTIDRDRLAIVASPVVLPAGSLDGTVGDEAPPAHDFALLAAWLRGRGELTLVKAPSMARRVGDESALRVLECLDELGRRVHEA